MDTTLWVRLQAAADGGLPRGARLRERAEVDTRDRPVDFDGQRAPPLRQRGADLGLDGGGVVLPQPVPDVVLPDQALRVLGLVPRYQTRRAMLCGRPVGRRYFFRFFFTKTTEAIGGRNQLSGGGSHSTDGERRSTDGG